MVYKYCKYGMYGGYDIYGMVICMVGARPQK